MGAKLLRAGSHVFGCIDQSLDARIVERPPFTTLPVFREHRILGVCGNRLEAEVVEVSLQCPKAVTGDVGVVGEGIEDVLEVIRCLPVGAVPSELIHDEYLAVSNDGSRIMGECFSGSGRCAPAEKRVPVWIKLEGDEIAAGVVDDFRIGAEDTGGVEIKVVGVDLLDMSADGFGPCGNLGESSLTASGEEGDDAAHVAVLPGHDCGVVAVANARDRVHMVENSVDVMLVSSDDGWIGEKVLRILLSIPGEILAKAADGA